MQTTTNATSSLGYILTFHYIAEQHLSGTCLRSGDAFTVERHFPTRAETDYQLADAILGKLESRGDEDASLTRVVLSRNDGDGNRTPLKSTSVRYGEYSNRYYIITSDPINEVNAVIGSSVRRFGLDTLPDLVLHAYPHEFRLLDDDGEVYFYGVSRTCDDEAAFAPLDSIGHDYGCVWIQYRNAETGEWETL